MTKRFIKFTLAVGGGLVLIGVIFLFLDSNSLLWLLMYPGFLALLTPVNVLAIRERRLPKPIPWWLALGSIVLFDVASVSLLGIDTEGHILGDVALFSFILPTYICFSSAKSMITGRTSDDSV